MAARDEAIDALHRARPDLPEHLASPTSAAAQALLEEILSMQTIEPGVADTTPGPMPDLMPTPAPERPRRRLVLVAAASVVAFAAAAFVAVHAVGGDDPDAIRMGPSSGGPAPAASGRLEVSWDLDWDMVPAGAQEVTAYEWSGDDFRFTTTGTGSEYRLVDGQAWLYEADLSLIFDGGSADPADLPHHWYDTNVHRPALLDLDPATLFDRLATAGPFEPVGDEDVAGVPTQHRRATQPELADVAGLADLGPFYEDGGVTGLDVWVDGDGVTRRVDVVWEGVEQAEPFTETFSLTWSDLGEPISIEAPPVG